MSRIDSQTGELPFSTLIAATDMNELTSANVVCGTHT
jgi:hypothetical protein